VRIDPKPTVPEVLPLAIAYVERHPIGGNLHIVLDGRNFGDHHVLLCAEQAAEAGDRDGVRLARILLRMSRIQRRRLNALLRIPLTASTTVS